MFIELWNAMIFQDWKGFRKKGSGEALRRFSLGKGGDNKPNICMANMQ
jgi:hypothetical protein